MTHHQYKTSADCGCDNQYCRICEGGLSVCKVCGLYEGCLTTECPGYQCYEECSDNVYSGKIDFRNGKWVCGVTIHMQHLYSDVEENK